MENKIVYLKTFLITIATLIVIFAIALGGCVYYYENKLNALEEALNQKDELTIIQDDKTGFENVVAE